MAMTVTQNGVARAVQGVFYMMAGQENEYPYPCIIVNQPILRFLPQHLQCNGVYIAQATFLQDVRCIARDVEPNNSGLRTIRARVKTLLEGYSGAVTGGTVSSCIVDGFPPDSRYDNGGFIYSESLITFRITTQTT